MKINITKRDIAALASAASRFPQYMGEKAWMARKTKTGFESVNWDRQLARSHKLLL